MATVEKAILSDPEVFPDDLLLKSLIGAKMEWWNEIVEHTTQHYQSVTPVWRYYNDGKQWLFRLLQKKETIFWTSLIDDTFRTTFYFTDKYETRVLESLLPEEVKSEFISAKRYGKLRGITIRMENASDVETVKQLIAIKLQIR